jgi:hypothetical protein
MPGKIIKEKFAKSQKIFLRESDFGRTRWGMADMVRQAGFEETLSDFQSSGLPVQSVGIILYFIPEATMGNPLPQVL